LRQQFGVFWYNQVGPSNAGPILVDDVSIDTTFNSIAGGPGPQAFSLDLGADVYNVTGAQTTLNAPTAGPTLIGFVHRALLVTLITALLVWRRRRSRTNAR
jgi:hypothetical protein